MHACPPQAALTLLIHGEVCVEEHGVAYLRLIKSASLSHRRARSRKRLEGGTLAVGGHAAAGAWWGKRTVTRSSGTRQHGEAVSCVQSSSRVSIVSRERKSTEAVSVPSPARPLRVVK